MAFVVNDRVKETTTSTGTGTINLAGAETGFETFVAGIGNSNTTYYCIQAQGGSAFEIGVGTVTDASPDTLSRTAIISSSNSDAVVDFAAGTKDVFCTLPASKAVIEDSSTNADIAGNLTIGGTVDGVDIAARDAVLTSTTTTATNANTTANAALPKAGGTMTGNIVMSGSETVDGVDISARDAVLSSTTTTATNAETTANAALPKAGGTMTGNLVLSSANITMSGSETVDGVDISARDSVLTSTTTTANAALPKAGGTMTGDISHASNFTLDIGGNIRLDADDNGEVRLLDGGTQYGALKVDSSRLKIQGIVSDADMMFAVNDGGSEITALTLDASEQGNAIFNKNAVFADNGKALFGDGTDLAIYHDGNDSYITEEGTGTLIIRGSTAVRITNVGGDNMFQGTDGGAAELYHAGTKMFSTTSSGCQVEADKRLEIVNGANWSGEQVGKIEHHSNSMYHQFNTSWIARNSSGNNMFTLDSSGNGTFNANVTAYSDNRLKEDIKTIDNALDKVCKLRGVEYTRKETKAREIGVIAQEVKEIVPELVAIENLKSDINPDALEDMHTMKYQNTVGLLIEAIKELKAEIETLKKDK